jgi:cytochrome c biogenesis protein CcdA
MPVSLPTLGTVLIAALIDSINPCAIGVLILLVSVMILNKSNRSRMLTLGTFYILAVMLTYLAAGLGLTYFFTTIPLAVTVYISIAVALIIILAGLIEIKDFYWYGKGFSLSISPNMAKKIHKFTESISIPGIILLGVFVSAVELPCTGGPYLAIILLLSQSFDITAFSLLLLYNIIFVLPLIIILLLVLLGVKIQNIKLWKHKYRHYMRLATGIILIFLGWLLVLIANGTINLG